MEKTYTTTEAARIIAVCPETARRWLRAGHIRGQLPGGRKAGYRIPESELVRILGLESPPQRKAAPAAKAAVERDSSVR